ncbi:MAG: 2'-deoxycytidine 5'-triphosphate deaminase [Mycobacteriales bacterium]
MDEPVSFPEGVLPDTALQRAIGAGMIHAGDYRIAERQIQPASLDLTLGKVAHRLRCSFLPDREPVEHKLKELSEGQIDLRKEGPGFLERGIPYLVELREEVALPQTVRAKANPKSSTGRLDVFTRIITDRSYQFDEIAFGYHGKLYLEIVPISFPIRVCEGLSLNQLRLISGKGQKLSDDEIRAEHSESPLLFNDGKRVSDRELAVSNGLFLSLDLRGDEKGFVGYKARRNTRLLDLTREERADPHEFWEPVAREKGDRIVLEPEDFYLLMSRETVHIPPHLASEMVAYDPTSGELRTHYAGFFDPGFGHATRRIVGSRAALEVRAHDVAFIVEHGQGVCKLSFERMAAPPMSMYGAQVASNYQGQTSTLSKYFVPPSGQSRLL